MINYGPAFSPKTRSYLLCEFCNKKAIWYHKEYRRCLKHIIELSKYIVTGSTDRNRILAQKAAKKYLEQHPEEALEIE